MGTGISTRLWGSSGGDLNFFENTGSSTSAAFAAPVTPFGLSDVGDRSKPTFADIDGDGDLDAFVGEFEGNVNFFENTGSSTSAAFSLSSDSAPFGLSDVGRDSAPTLVDIDGDGDLDAFVGEKDGSISFFENTGSATSAAFAALVTSAPFGLSDVGGESAPTLVDIDGDGDLDAFVGEVFRSLNFFENVAALNQVSITILDADRGEGDFGATGFTFILTRTGDTTCGSAVDFAVTGNTGLDATDFHDGELPSGTVTFAAGETSKILTIDVSGDTRVESDEVFTVRLSSPSGVATLGTESAIGTIQTDDTPFATAEFTLSTSASPFGLSDLGQYSTPTFADIDGDGDLDAFVGEFDGNVNFFENTGDAMAAAFGAPVTDSPFGLSDVGFRSTPTLADIDADGDLDAFVGGQGGKLSFFENTGGSTLAAFATPLTNSPLGLSDVGSSIAPALVDIDGDGDLDAFFGEQQGGAYFFENTGSSTSAAFAAPVSGSPFGLSDVGLYSSPAFADVDGDGDLDAFVGEYAGNLNFFENTGSSTSAAFASAVTSSPFGLSVVGLGSAPTFADIDGDGDLDAFVGEAYGNINFFENVAPLNEVSIVALNANQAEGDAGVTAFTFTLTRSGDTTDASTVDFAVTGSGTDPADATDFDGGALPSGTATFAAGETSQTLTLEVSGDTTPEVNEQFTVTLSNPSAGTSIDTDTASETVVTDDGLVFELSTSPAPLGLTDVGTESQVALGDLDGDGDLDALVGDTSGVMRYFENTGSASAPAYVQVGGSSPFGLPDVGTVIAPTLGDLDGDGDLDLLVGKNGGRMNYFENTGDGSSAAFVKVGGNVPFGLPDTGDRSTPTLVDIDADGDLDLFVGDLDGGVRYFKNLGDVEEAVFVPRGGVTPFGLVDVGSRTTLTFVDLDGDGDFDALVGEGNGRVNYFENTGSAQKRAFAAPVTDTPFGLEDVGRHHAPVAADIDGDGDIDVLVGEEDGNINLFTNISPPTLSITALDAMQAEGHTGTTDLTFTVSRTGDTTATSTVDYGVIAHGGLDGDDFEAGTVPTGTVTFAVGEVEHTLTLTVSGDVEVESDEAFVVRLTNVGGGQLGASQALGVIEADDAVGAPVFELSTSPSPLGLNAVGLESRVTLGDLDGDGDLDALVSDATGILSYFENTGSASAPAYLQVGGSALFGLPDTGSFSAPALGDLDGDGDLDLLVGVNSGRFKYYENTGDASSAAFVRVGGNAPFGLPDTGDLSTPALVDIDADGDLDLFVGNLDGGIRYFKNIGDVEVAVFVRTRPRAMPGTPRSPSR